MGFRGRDVDLLPVERGGPGSGPIGLSSSLPPGGRLPTRSRPRRGRGIYDVGTPELTEGVGTVSGRVGWRTRSGDCLYCAT